ncbi:MAG: dynamin family protein [Bacteroidales bacterium]|nr:dynamin family protein [Candidatus Physcocola equi]
MSKSYNEAITELSSIIFDGEKDYNLDLSEIKLKIESVKKLLSTETLRIVLLGTTCDGKTTTAAGMLGRLHENMKIDLDESSDELTFYKIDGGVEIVDTPGLFGSKEKEVMGKNVVYSAITERYISEAHIVLYVTDAVDPVKESHSEKLKWVLKDLSKLSSTIFVINKMDEAGFDLLDESDFQRGSSIKKKFLVDGLSRNIGLTATEAANMNVICISADPKGKGLAYWFGKPDEYLRRSHINVLRTAVQNTYRSSDIASLNKNAIMASFRDITKLVKGMIGTSSEQVKKALLNAKKTHENIQFELNDLNKQLLHNKKILIDSLLSYRQNLIHTINNTGMEAFSSMLDEEIGTENGKVTGGIFVQKIESLLAECGNNNSSSISLAAVSYENNLGILDSSISIIGEGTKLLKSVNMTGDMVKGIRNIVLPSFKFKPWQAVNIAKNFSKIVLALNVVVDVILFWRKKKAKDDFIQAKNELKNFITNSFEELNKMYDPVEEYYKNFAPHFIEMSMLKAERRKLVESLESSLNALAAYDVRLSAWLSSVTNN